MLDHDLFNIFLIHWPLFVLVFIVLLIVYFFVSFLVRKLFFQICKAFGWDAEEIEVDEDDLIKWLRYKREQMDTARSYDQKGFN